MNPMHAVRSVGGHGFSGFSRMNPMHRDENAARTLAIINSTVMENCQRWSPTVGTDKHSSPVTQLGTDWKSVRTVGDQGREFAGRRTDHARSRNATRPKQRDQEHPPAVHQRTH